MASKTKNAKAPKKQKTTSSSTAVKKIIAPAAQKKRALRRIASTESQSDLERRRRDRRLPSIDDRRGGNRDSLTPTPSQPPPDSRQRATRRPDRPDITPDNSDQDDDDETLAALGKLPEEVRYKVMGKVFALTVFPWPSPNWWIAKRNQSQVSRAADPDAKERNRFTTFLAIDMGLSSEEWMRPVFKQEVLLFFTLRHDITESPDSFKEGPEDSDPRLFQS
jgi:hypothetical protein